MEFDSRIRSNYLTLSGVDRIPTLSNISYLQLNGRYRRMMLPTVALQLAAFLPNLKHIYGSFGGLYE